MIAGAHKTPGQGDYPLFCTDGQMTRLTSVPQLADYPGVIPYSKTRQLLQSHTRGTELPPEERTVRGTLVKGLGENDIALLDVFEGDVSHSSINATAQR